MSAGCIENLRLRAACPTRADVTLHPIVSSAAYEHQESSAETFVRGSETMHICECFDRTGMAGHMCRLLGLHI